MILAASHPPRGGSFTLLGSGYIVGPASDRVVTRPACSPRLLPEERQVLSNDLLKPMSGQSLTRLHVALLGQKQPR